MRKSLILPRPNDPISHIAAAANVYAVVKYWADAAPDAEAMVHGDKRTSYAQFHARINQLARALLAAGVKKATASPHCRHHIQITRSCF